MSSHTFGFASVQSGEIMVRRVHSGSRRFTCALLNVAEFIQVRVGSLGRT